MQHPRNQKRKSGFSTAICPMKRNRSYLAKGKLFRENISEVSDGLEYRVHRLRESFLGNCRMRSYNHLCSVVLTTISTAKNNELNMKRREGRVLADPAELQLRPIRLSTLS